MLWTSLTHSPITNIFIAIVGIFLEADDGMVRMLDINGIIIHGAPFFHLWSGSSPITQGEFFVVVGLVQSEVTGVLPFKELDF